MHKPLAPLALRMAAAAVLLASAGCSTQEPTLIQAGSQKVTVADFERAARGAQAQYAGPPDMAKAQLAEDLTSRAMMLEMAHVLGHESVPVLVNTEKSEMRRALIQALYARMASPVQKVSEAEARALYDARNVEAEVLMIYTSTETTARGAMRRLQNGEPFEQVSRSYSLPGLLPPDGNMGMIPPGSLPDPLDAAVRHQKIGEIGGPFRTREGWFVVVIKSRQPRQQPTWEVMRAGMFDLGRQRKQRAAFNRSYEDLKAEWNLQLTPGGSQFLFHVISPVQPLQPTPEQMKTVLATYNGGQYTMKDASDDLQDATVSRPPANVLPALEIWIEQQVMMRVAELEAKRRHLHEEPEIVAQVRAKREEMLLEGIAAAAVANVPPPGPEQVRMAWEQLKDRFVQLVEADVAIAVAPDTARVMKLIQQGQTVRALPEAAQATDPAITVTQTHITFPSSDPQWSSMTQLLTQMQPGAWFGPEPAPEGGFRVLQLVNKRVQQQTFEELPPAMQQNIAANAGELARNQRFTEFRDSLVKVYHPVINQPLLAKLPWPPRMPLDVGR